MPTPRLTACWVVLLAVFSSNCVSRLSAADTNWTTNSLLPAESLLSVHVDSLGEFYDSPIVQAVWERIQNSQQLREGLQTVEVQQFRELLTFFEQRLGRSSRDFYRDLTASGVDLCVTADKPQKVLFVATTKSEQLAADVIALVKELATTEGGGELNSGEHRGITGYRIGHVALAAVGTRLLISSDSELIKETVDRILDDAPRTTHEMFSPRVSVRLNLKALRSLPGATNNLQVPSGDAGLMAILGGWIDLLRRHESAILDFTVADGRIDTVVRIEGASDSSPESFAGYWADDDGERPAPLLQLPGTIYSTTWYRNYGALWDAREQLATADVVKKMEQANQEAAAQFETLGSAVSLSEVVQQFGPRFRIVVAEQTAPPYEIELRNQLPAAALVIELQDEEKFREIAEPLARVVHLILSFEQKITSQPVEHAGATLQQLSLPHTEKDISGRDRGDYNFRPTHTITRGHLIVGSTPEIVRQTVNALDQQATLPERLSPSGLTAEQFVDIPALAKALDRMRDAIVRQSVLNGTLDVETAEQEFDILLDVLRLFDRKSIAAVFADGDFESRITVTTAQAPTNTPTAKRQ